MRLLHLVTSAALTVALLATVVGCGGPKDKDLNKDKDRPRPADSK